MAEIYIPPQFEKLRSESQAWQANQAGTPEGNSRYKSFIMNMLTQLVQSTAFATAFSYIASPIFSTKLDLSMAMMLGAGLGGAIQTKKNSWGVRSLVKLGTSIGLSTAVVGLTRGAVTGTAGVAEMAIDSLFGTIVGSLSASLNHFTLIPKKTAFLAIATYNGLLVGITIKALLAPDLNTQRLINGFVLGGMGFLAQKVTQVIARYRS